MGFDSLIQELIGVADDQTKSLQVTIRIRAYTGQDGFGKKSYLPASPDPGTPYKAIVTMMDQLRPMPGGGSINIKAQVTILQPVLPTTPLAGQTRQNPIDPRDIIILPDGSTAPIVSEPGLLNPSTGNQYFADILLGKQV
jgi:hypothetical protein